MLCCFQELSRVSVDLQLVQDDLDTVTVRLISSVSCCIQSSLCILYTFTCTVCRFNLFCAFVAFVCCLGFMIVT